jgi:uncharacterized membrane protein
MVTELEATTRIEAVRPATSSEYITVLSHYYRGELARMTSWRDRIDQTSHWAIAAAGAMLSVSLASGSSHHGVMLFAMVLIYLMLHIEARRYRFFDVYRTRVRLIERNYYAEIFSPEKITGAPEDWKVELAETLRRPKFTISLNEALARRLKRNYIWMFLVILAAWVLKISSEMLQFRGSASEFFQSTGTLFSNAKLGALPGWFVVIGVVSFYSRMFYVMFKYDRPRGELIHGEVHV